MIHHIPKLLSCNYISLSNRIHTRLRGACYPLYMKRIRLYKPTHLVEPRIPPDSSVNKQ